ncbi:unnamed protein product [Chironomus riparius]|uniref:C2H2-type domain-containing protein n=1 Tax=Chironomus riparius TaxID=315576 RepID=A0A9N9RKV9_9DIPT|nr:unnamed protein product [Chironomus riparius]
MNFQFDLEFNRANIAQSNLNIIQDCYWNTKTQELKMKLRSHKIIKTKQETLEQSFEKIKIKSETENEGITDVSCEIIEPKPAEDLKNPRKKEPDDDETFGMIAIRDIHNLKGSIEAEDLAQFIGEQDKTTIIIDDEISDNEDCEIVRFPCNICRRSFLTEKDLDLHRRRHSWPFVCKTCRKRFERAKFLRTHQQIKHELPKIHACPTCGKKFTTTSAMNDHKKSHDKNQTKAFNCEVCKFACNAKKSFKKHKKRHQKVKLEPKTELVDVKIEPKTELIDVKTEPKVFLFGGFKIGMDS